MMKKLVLLFLLAPWRRCFAADEAHTIVQKGRAFHPGEVTINRGESLTFTNDDDFIHQIYLQGSGFSFDSDEKTPGENLTETFTAGGNLRGPLPHPPQNEACGARKIEQMRACSASAPTRPALSRHKLRLATIG